MAYRAGLITTGEISVARSAASAPVADNATLTDANIDPAQSINCSGYDTIFVGCEVTGGTVPTLTVEPLFRNANAADGSRWVRLLTGVPDGVTLASAANQSTGALTNGTNFAEVKVYGQSSVFLRITAVGGSGSPTAWKILVMPGRKRL